MKKLYRSRKNRIVGGICGGIAEIYNIDVSFIRLATVFLGLITAVAPLLITYLVGIIIIPEENVAGSDGTR